MGQDKDLVFFNPLRARWLQQSPKRRLPPSQLCMGVEPPAVLSPPPIGARGRHSERHRPDQVSQPIQLVAQQHSASLPAERDVASLGLRQSHGSRMGGRRGAESSNQFEIRESVGVPFNIICSGRSQVARMLQAS